MTDSTNKTIKLTICSSATHLPVVRAAVEKLCEQIGFDEKSIGQIVLSIDEALTNIIRHAYEGADDKPIYVKLAPFVDAEGTGLKISLEDHGRQVDPAKIKSRDLKDIRPGGLGVHIMKECMDCVDYRPVEGGGTLLSMAKRLKHQQEDP